MALRIEAVFENGVLRPLEPLRLKERQRVSVVISERPGPLLDEWLDHDYLAAIDSIEEAEATLDEVYRASSGIRGSLAEAVRAERDQARA